MTKYAVACAVLALTATGTFGSETKVFPDAPQRNLVVRACAACHAPEMVVAKRHTAEEWDDIIAKMVDRGAVATDEEQQQILDYLVKFFGVASPPRS